MKKIIGILAGMGPAASVALFDNIVKMTDAKSDQENIRIIIDNNTSIPDRTAYIIGKGTDPRKHLIESALKLKEAGADFIIMPCNTAHYFYKEIKDGAGVSMVHLIEETVKNIVERGIQKVGLLATTGTIKTNIYNSIGARADIDIIIPDIEYQEKNMKFIYDIKEGRNGCISDFNEAIENLKSKGAEFVILGCTELSVANNIHDFGDKFIDPLKIISEVAIELAGYKVKK